MSPRRPRVPEVLAARIDVVRGGVPFERWVREALEAALSGQRPGDTRGLSGSGSVKETAPTESSASPRAPFDGDDPVTASEKAAYLKASAGGSRSVDVVVEGGSVLPSPAPTEIQLAGHAGCTIVLARQMLKDGSWRAEWPDFEG